MNYASTDIFSSKQLEQMIAVLQSQIDETGKTNVTDSFQKLWDDHTPAENLRFYSLSLMLTISEASPALMSKILENWAVLKGSGKAVTELTDHIQIHRLHKPNSPMEIIGWISELPEQLQLAFQGLATACQITRK